MRRKFGPSRLNENADRFPWGRSIIATYDYRDETGDLLFQVVRFVPKDFRQRRPDGKGGWIWSLGETRRVLYRLPEIMEAVASERTIFLAEGEKAVDALVKLGVQATCSSGGAGKWLKEHSQHLAGAHVVILPDNDEPGEQHYQVVMGSITGIARSVRVLRLPGLPDKGDPYNWIQAGGTAEQIWRLLENKADREVASADAGGAGLISRCASEVEPQPIEWLWPGRIARGKHTCIAGEPGTGKSQLSIFLAATTSLGGAWPCGEGHAPRGSVIILSAEDGEADTIVPHLHAAGADCGRVHLATAVRTEDGERRRGFNLQADLLLLEKKIAEIGDVLAVVVDPISSYLGRADSHKNAEVRGVLEPLSEMAERLRVAIVSITHFSKANVGPATKALHKFIGSIAFVGAPRTAFAVMEDANDRERRLFLHAKNNLAEPPQGLAFRLEQTVIGPSRNIVTSRVKWESEPVTITANEALSAASESKNGHTALEEAKSFLRAILSAGPMPAKEVCSEAEDAAIASATLRRAKEELGIKPRRVALAGAGLAENGRWMWELP